MPSVQPLTRAASVQDSRMTLNRRDSRGILLCVFPFWILTIVLGLLSRGVHHDDDLVHFLMARWSWTYPAYLLHIWGRPGATIPLALVSGFRDVDFAWHAARMLSSLVTALTAILAACVARSLGVKRPWRVAAACYMQPLFMILGFTTLTENFTAFYLVAATALSIRGRTLVASAVFSLALLTRHEAVIFLPPWILLICWKAAANNRHRVGIGIASSIMSLWAPFIHNLLYRLFLGGWPVQIFFQPSGSTQYLPTGWNAYLPDAAYAVTPAIGILALIGAAFWRPNQVGGSAPLSKAPAEKVSSWVRLWIVAAPLVFLVTHMAIKAFGLFASGGFPRFMVAVSPFIAILAVGGWEVLWNNDRRSRSATGGWLVAGICWVVIALAVKDERFANRLSALDSDAYFWLLFLCLGLALASWFALASVRPGWLRIRPAVLIFMGVLALVHWGLIVRPLRPKPEQDAAHRVVEWLDAHQLADRPIFAANPWIVFDLGLIEHPRSLKNAELLASMPVGTIFIWDSLYSGSDYHGIAIAEVDQTRAYRLLTTLEFRSDAPVFELYEKIADTPMPTRVRPSYPRPLESILPPVRGVFYVREMRRPTAR